MNATAKIQKARAGLILDAPFFGSLALRLTLREDSTKKTAATDGKSLIYNPAYIDGLTLDAVKGLICHEVMHCALSHMTRRAGREMEKWNIAADHAINPIIREAGFYLPEGALLSPAFDGMSAEEIYSALPNDPEGGSGDQGAGDGQGAGDDPDGAPGSFGDVIDAPGGAAEKNETAGEWKVNLQQAANIAAGKIPAALKREIDKILDPVLPWRALLRQYVNQLAKNDYSFFPPNKRHIYRGIFLPSLRSNEIGRLTICLDTSGSIDAAALSSFKSEIDAIRNETGAAVKLIYADAEVNDVQEFGAFDPLEMEMKGGGGTDFRPALEYAADDPGAVVIYFTDMEGTFPETAPAFPLIWINAGAGDYMAPFGDTIAMKGDF